MSMRWLGIGIFYYLIGYVLAGGILVQWFGLLTWEHMTGVLVGLLVGHYLGRSDRVTPKLVSGGYSNVQPRTDRHD